MIRPVRLIPKRTMNAPILVIKEATPSQASLPRLPALPRVAIEIKKSKDPTRTFGWLKGILILERRKARERKTNGKNIVAQENESTSRSFSLTRISPRLVKEIIINAARAKKTIWEMEKIVALLSLRLNFLLGTLWCFFAMTTLYPTYLNMPTWVPLYEINIKFSRTLRLLHDKQEADLCGQQVSRWRVYI